MENFTERVRGLMGLCNKISVKRDCLIGLGINAAWFLEEAGKMKQDDTAEFSIEKQNFNDLDHEDFKITITRRDRNQGN